MLYSPNFEVNRTRTEILNCTNKLSLNYLEYIIDDTKHLEL